MSVRKHVHWGGAAFCLVGCFLTALWGRAGHALEAAKADSWPEITLAGTIAFDAWMGGQKSEKKAKFEKKKDNTGVDIQSATGQNIDDALNFSIDRAKIDFGVTDKIADSYLESWFFNLTLSGDRNAKTYSIVPRVYLGLFMKHSTLTLGDHPGVEDTMSHGGAELMSATGGFASPAHASFVSLTAGCYTKVTLMGDNSDATKIILQSPRLWGVQFGANYTPDSRLFGKKKRTSTTAISGLDLLYSKDLWGFGVDYVDFVGDNVKLSVSVTGVTGTSYAAPDFKPIEFYRTGGVGSGFLLDFDRFSFGVEGAWMAQTSQIKGDYAGVAPPKVGGGKMPAKDYKASDATGPWFLDAAFSVFLNNETRMVLGYYYSQRSTGFKDDDGGKIYARMHIVNLSLTYQLAKSIQTYIEGFYHNTKNPAAPYEVSHFLSRASGLKSWEFNKDEQSAWTIVLGVRASF